MGLWLGLISPSAPSREDDSFLRRTAAVSRNSALGTGFRRLIHKDDVDMDQLKEYRVEERYAGSGNLSHFLEWKE